MAWLGLTPAAFWALTPGEFNVMILGAQDRYNREREVDAWRIRKLVSPHVDRKEQYKLDPDKILAGCPGYVKRGR